MMRILEAFAADKIDFAYPTQTTFTAAPDGTLVMPYAAAAPGARLMPVATLDDIRGRIGEEVGVSDWLTIDQARIDAFADATEDRQFIHVDPAGAAQTPFGGTIAHGFLSLSLLSRMAAEAMLVPDTLKMAVNYGLDRVRFLGPVRSGKRVRGRFTLESVEEKRARPNTSAPRGHGRDRGRRQARADRRLAGPAADLRRFECPATPSSFRPPGRRSAAPTRARSTRPRDRRSAASR